MKEGKVKKPFYKKWWFYLIIAIFVIGAIGGGDDEPKEEAGNTPGQSEQGKSTDSGDGEEVKEVQGDVAPKEEPKEKVPTEYKSALKKAKVYSDTMNMSKAGVYDQLTSDYGEKFSAEAGQYAIDNVVADWKENALKKAKTYQNDMSMSPNAVYDQLVSDHGEKFTAEEAQYAVDNLE